MKARTVADAVLLLFSKSSLSLSCFVTYILGSQQLFSRLVVVSEHGYFHSSRESILLDVLTCKKPVTSKVFEWKTWADITLSITEFCSGLAIDFPEISCVLLAPAEIPPS